MKRYALSILLGLFIAAGISTYYVFGTEDHLPEFKLSTVQGDAKEGEAIELSGSYVGRYPGESLNVSIEGSDYRSRQSLYRKEVIGARSWLNSDIKQMVKDQPQFMRGKAGSVTNFYQDDEWIVFADASTKNEGAEVILRIELLDRTTNEVKRYETAVPSKMNNAYVIVSDVQRVGDRIHILTNQYPRLSSNPDTFVKASGILDEYYDYVIDAASGKLIESIKLPYDTGGINGSSYIKPLEPYSAPRDYALLTVQETNETSTGERSIQTMTDTIYAYSYKTGKLTVLPKLSNNNSDSNQAYGLHGSLLVHLKQQQNKAISLVRYHLDSGLKEEAVTTITAKQLGADRIVTAFIKNERIYILLQKEGVPMVVVLNMIDGSLLYKGEVTFDGLASDAAKEMNYLRLVNMNVR